MKANTERRTAVLAAGAAAIGGALVVAVLFAQSAPRPWWLWMTLAAAFVVLEFWSVEVNDRLFISSSIMVAFAAAVMFDRNAAVLAVTLMAAVSVLHPSDLKVRRWRQPAFNFGQLVVSNAVGVLVLLPFLPHEPLEAADVPLLTLGALLASVVYNWLNFRFVAGYARIAYPDQALLPWSRMLVNHAFHAVLGAYGALLGASYVIVGPVTLPLMLITFLVGHVGFASYGRLRRAHEDTVAGFVKAVEALDPYTKGHTDRVAHFARLTGERMGLGPDELQVLRWAALIHDVGQLAVPAELMGKTEPLTERDRARFDRRVQMVERLLAQVEFLRPIVESSTMDRSSDEEHPLVARIIGSADAFDAMTSTRSYRAAITQAAAFDRLRDDVDTYGAEVVEALIVSIEESGVRYGTPDAAASAEAERLVFERARRD